MVETVLVLAFFLGATALGMASLNARHSKDGLTSIWCPDEFFGQSLMIAAGRGPLCPNIDTVPGMRDFVTRQTNTFDAGALPADIPLSRETSAEYHLCLIWVVAAVWRVFGISWLAVEPFLALGLGLCAAFVYGLFRLGMNRGISIAGTILFVSSPAVLGQLNSLRDFSKAPFLLAGIFALGWLMTRRTPPRFLPAAAALMGLAAGLGMGFRQDSVILVPASLMVILVLSPGETYGTRRRRIMAALVYIMAFAATAWPMFMRMEGGAQPYHPLAQGYSTSHLCRCSLNPGVCEPLACSVDGFIYDTVTGYARRAARNDQINPAYNSPEAVRFTRDWVVATALQFPADTLARVYGSTLNVVAGADNYPISLCADHGPMAWIAEAHLRAALFLRAAGPVFAVLALLAAAAVSFRASIALLFFGLYFCGYVSLDNEWRHTFHLTFVAFWVAGFVAQCVLVSVARTFAGTSEWNAWARRAVLFAVFATLFLTVPWQFARILQRHAVDAVLRDYAAAPRTQVQTAAKPMREWTLFQLEGGDLGDASRTSVPGAAHPQNGPSVPDGTVGALWESHCTLYAAHFADGRDGRVVMTKYCSKGTAPDYTQLLRVAGDSASSGDAWFFFPTYDGPEVRFEGIALPGEDADHFLGLYRIGEKGLPALLPCATLQGPRSRDRLCAGIKVPYDSMDLQTPETPPQTWQAASYFAEKTGHLDNALTYLRACDGLFPSRQNLEREADLYYRSGNRLKALDVLKFLVTSQGDYVACEKLDRFLADSMTLEQRQQIWESIIPTAETSGQIWLHYGLATATNQPDKAVNALRAAVMRMPGNQEAVAALQQALIHKGCRNEQDGDIPGAIDAYQKAIQVNPANSEPYWRLDTACPKTNPEVAVGLWREIRESVAENAAVDALYGESLASANSADAARPMLESALRLGGNDSHVLVHAGDAYFSMADWAQAVACYDRALAANPGLEFLHPRLEEARKRHAAAETSESPAPVSSG